jgi:hypothetical protein
MGVLLLRIINVHNVNQALAEGLDHLNYSGIVEESRAGRVLVSPEPVTTIYQHPNRRVLMSPLRDANPFFHVMEALWMLAGRQDVKFISHYNRRIASFSDDGVVFHGAYGYRWRHYYDNDQLKVIKQMLLGDRTTRRAVISMWDPNYDLGWDSNDIPCNDIIFFDTLGGALNATVCCRSNDMWWGAHGANAVHFSFLLEYMAAGARLPMGVLRQMSNNYHAYLNVVKRELMNDYADDAADSDPYTTGQSGGRYYQRRPLTPGPGLVPLVNDADTFDKDLAVFMANPTSTDECENNPFFHQVACPMARAWEHHKFGAYHKAQEQVDRIVAGDWRKACEQWLERRRKHVAG